MKIYSARKMNQSLFPRHHTGLTAKTLQLENGEGRRLYDESVVLKTDEIRGPLNVNAGDMVIILDYVNEVPIYFVMKYLKAI